MISDENWAHNPIKLSLFLLAQFTNSRFTSIYVKNKNNSNKKNNNRGTAKLTRNQNRQIRNLISVE